MRCASCWEEVSCGQNSSGKVAFGPGFTAELSSISAAAASQPGSSEPLKQRRASLAESVPAALSPAAAIKALSAVTLCRWKWRSRDDLENKHFLPRKARDSRLAK